MKIACIGNMNNMVFPICLYLLEEKHEVTLFYLDEYEHFKPNPELVPKRLEIIQLGWNESTFGSISKHLIQSIFKDFDFFIGTDYAAAYLAKAGISMDIYMPAGSDLFLYPFKKFNNILPGAWEIGKVICARSQFFGIKHAKFISLDYTNSIFEKSLLKIGGISKRIPVLPFLYFKNNCLHALSNSKEVKSSSFNILQHSRQAWTYQKDNPHNKGNDILIQGFAKFAKKNSEAKLTLLEYGEHIMDSKKLIAQLGLQSRVQWLPKMHKDDLMTLIKNADICVGNLHASFLSYGSVYESLASKVAFMGYRKDELYKDSYTELYPMINVSTPEEVAEKLEYYYHHREELEIMGKKGYDWLLNYAINPSVYAVLEIVKNHKGRKKLPIDWRLVVMEPYFWFIKIYNFFKIKLSR